MGRLGRRWGRGRCGYDSDSAEPPYQLGDDVHEYDESLEASSQGSFGRSIFKALEQCMRGNVGDVSHFANEAEIPNPGIYFKDFGYIGQPTNAATVTALKNQSLLKAAPFGDTAKKQTCVDKSVRDVWECDANGFEIRGEPAWSKFLDRHLEEVKKKFGLDQNTSKRVEASLYKLLIYEKGGHFKMHKDTEKSPGMFATMSIVLPCAFKGGDLKIVHGGKTENYVPSANSSGVSTGSVLAWYSDVDHEVSKVTEGLRVALVYNLSVRSVGNNSSQAANTPRPPEDISAATQGVMLEKLLRDSARKDAEWRFFYLLEHKYSLLGLDNFGLKRRDRMAEKVLEDIARVNMEGSMKVERVKIHVTGQRDEDNEIEESNATWSIVVGDQVLQGSVVGDQVLQPVSISGLGTFTPQGYAGNYQPSDEQEYSGVALMLSFPPGMRAVAKLPPGKSISAVQLYGVLLESINKEKKIDVSEIVTVLKFCVKERQSASPVEEEAAPASSLPGWLFSLQGSWQSDQDDCAEVTIAGHRAKLRMTSGGSVEFTMKSVEDGKGIVLANAWGAAVWKSQNYRRPACPKKITWAPVSAGSSVIVAWSRSAGTSSGASSVASQSATKSITVTDTMIKELCAAIINADNREERRRPPNVANASINHWGNLALVKKDDGGRDPLFELVRGVSPQLRAFLRPVLDYVVGEYRGYVGELESKANNSEAVDAYKVAAQRVSDVRLKTYLQDSARAELKLPDMSKNARFDVHQMLNGVDVTHETIDRRGDRGTMVIRKKGTVAKIDQIRLDEIRQRRAVLDTLAQQLGPPEETEGPAAKKRRKDGNGL